MSLFGQFLLRKATLLAQFANGSFHGPMLSGLPDSGGDNCHRPKLPATTRGGGSDRSYLTGVFIVWATPQAPPLVGMVAARVCRLGFEDAWS